MRILGIDPGSRTTGYGLIDVDGSQCDCVNWGCLKLEASAFSDRIHQIYQGLGQIIQCYKPDAVSIEDVFVGQNARSALKLGQARGAAIVSVVSAGLVINEYAPRQIKQTVAGTGAADKKQIQQMVKLLLSLSETPPTDAADALAIALCHIYTQQSVINFRQSQIIPSKRRRRRWR